MYNKALSVISESDENSNICSVYFNIALCYNALSQWKLAIYNCKKAISYDRKYEKAYFRLIKCLLELRKFKESRLYFTQYLKFCGETKDLKLLELEYNRITSLILRPAPNHFEVVDDQLGDGNFSKIYKVISKLPDQTAYAMKVLIS
jgi:tetratricopeptide (TPR) repeat protein